MLSMANSKRRCGFCGNRFKTETMVIKGAQAFCTNDHWIENQVKNSDALIAKGQRMQKAAKRKEEIEEEKAAKAERKRLKQRKEALKPMSEHYDKLQDLVNQWIVHVRDKGKPCFTCGTAKPSIKYDAGHYRTRGACSELRFEITNIHKQCSVNCNQHGSGMRKEYRDKIVEVYGQDHLDWLDGKHPRLKDQLPDADAVNIEIVKYRKLLRAEGLKPCR